MYITFQLTKKQLKNIMETLDACVFMSSFKFEEGFKKIYKDAFAEVKTEDVFASGWKETVKLLQRIYFDDFDGDYSKIKSEDTEKLFKLSKKIHKASLACKEKLLRFDVDLNEDEINLIKWYLELPLRVVLGQWDRLGDFLTKTTFNGENVDSAVIYKTNKLIGDYRNDCVPEYLLKGLTACSSFGIYSHEISEKNREIYDFYKAFMYEAGVKGCYGTKVTKTARTDSPLPVVEFPLEHIESFEGSLEQFEECWNRHKDVEQLKRFSDEPNMIYLPVSEFRYQAVKHGNIVYKKRNGFYEIK